MDIKEHLQKLFADGTTPLPNLDDIYLQITEKFGTDPKVFNEHVNLLKLICLDRAIDYSKYKNRDLTPPAKVAQQPAPLKSSPITTAIKSSIDIRKKLNLCREKAPFLSFCFIRLSSAEANAPEKLHILFTKCIDENWVGKVFKPDSTNKLESGSSLINLDRKYSWIVLCLFHSRDNFMVPYLRELLNSNREMRILDIHDFDADEEEGSCWKKNLDNLCADTISNKPGLLISDLLNSEQECLVKEFYGSNASFLICSNLTSGLSGAKAILVSQSVCVGDEKKHVIKISEKSKSKLQKENDNFNNYVAPHWVPEQHLSADFKQSSRYHAIRYPFASKDTIQSSVSFSHKYRECSNVNELKTTIDKLFNHTLCARWRDITQTDERVVSDAFQEIFDYAKSNSSLEQILSPAYSKSSTLNRDHLSKVLSSKVNFYLCLNHGDLHSDNIQVDRGNDVFLIDFGLTGSYPAGFDYAALEASIRFRLLDYSVDYAILEGLDADPLSKFDNLIKPGGKYDGEVEKAQAVCSVIRERFLNDFFTKMDISTLKFQYLFCLLALCLRQINYRDLNRRYILQTLSQLIPSLYELVNRSIETSANLKSPAKKKIPAAARELNDKTNPPNLRHPAL